eukprot:1575628-Rhodomonas_salina.4
MCLKEGGKGEGRGGKDCTQSGTEEREGRGRTRERTWRQHSLQGEGEAGRREQRKDMWRIKERERRGRGFVCIEEERRGRMIHVEERGKGEGEGGCLWGRRGQGAGEGERGRGRTLTGERQRGGGGDITWQGRYSPRREERERRLHGEEGGAVGAVEASNRVPGDICTNKQLHCKSSTECAGYTAESVAHALGHQRGLHDGCFGPGPVLTPTTRVAAAAWLT